MCLAVDMIVLSRLRDYFIGFWRPSKICLTTGILSKPSS
nr:MAG TPA: hypothetical protein [Caudoviricetes sp.]